MTTSPEKTYGGLGAGERQAARRAALREAALELIAAGGTTAATVNSVCAAAGLNKRYFYESWATRDALLVDLLTAFFDDFYARTTSEIVDVPTELEGRLRHAVRSLLATLEAEPGTARLYAEAESEPALLELRTAAFDRFTGLFGAVADLDPEVPSTRFALYALVSGVTEALTHWLRGDPADLSRDEVVETSVQLCLAAIAVASR
ncbi:TetR/AcrR family transcriptional regulator [Sporichthya polymorpha]|uniref:TetR/AcrR family transcriptional regulator n=1 Tax=Sporichthya polymorpha TaxID=35751 RepID=UPI00038092A1|nr:TetR family transcriptional regulator [Sporichthya polymorpha]